MKSETRLCVIGGFLGAGKTTAILAIAKTLIQRGLRVGIVTNDQGVDLVDTRTLLAQNLNVLEVTGGCFCCNFDEFVKRVDELGADNADIILAEPVGSCTDLVATIFKPITRAHLPRFRVSPFTVIADPTRVQRLMRDEKSPFPNEINYLFAKQLEEADILLLNKCDSLPREQTDMLFAFLRERFPSAEVMRVSARTGEGLDAWLPRVAGADFVEKPSLAINYQLYGQAEAYLGWLNRSCDVAAASPVACGPFLTALLAEMQARLSAEIAHIKAYAVSGGGFIKANAVTLDRPPELTDDDSLKASSFRLVVNARAFAQPAALEDSFESALTETCARFAVSCSPRVGDAFAPGFPKPTHRV